MIESWVSARQRNTWLASVLLDGVRAPIYICAEYGTATRNERSETKQFASPGLSPRELDLFPNDHRELGESVASIFRNGGAPCVQTRGKDGSQKQKEESQ